MSRALSTKASIRILILKVGARTNRATNSLVESLSEAIKNINVNTVMALDKRQDTAFEVYLREIDRIRQASEEREAALNTALSKVPYERLAAYQAASKATTL